MKTLESTIYTVAGKEFELQHHGVKGMKWGHRKARPQSASARSRGTNGGDDRASTEVEKKARRKKVLKIGAAVVGTALAVYGAKKLHDVVRDKNYKYRMEQGSKAIDQYIKKTSTWYSPNDDWRTRLAQDARDEKYFKQVYNAASRQADKDSFGTAVRNAVTDELVKRVNVPRATVSRVNVGRVKW